MYKPNMSLKKTPALTQAIAERRQNFREVELVYTKEQAMEEAKRCLNCPGRYCAVSCPINTPVPEFIELIRDGDFKGAYEVISDMNPISPMSCRVCAQERQCEKNCTRGIKGEATAIGRLERFVMDWYRINDKSMLKKPEANGQRVAVVGSGPAGLVCAKILAQAGYGAQIYEAGPYAGGVPAYGIPDFVLPDEILNEYLEDLAQLGVAIHLNKPVNDEFSVADILAEGNGAVFIATGAGRSILLGIEGETLPNVFTASGFLLGAKRSTESLRQRARHSIAVVGGGNTAIDVCRSAIRLGSKEVHLLYRRTREEMPARMDEIQYAMEEGVRFHFLTQPVRLLEAEGEIDVVCSLMETCEPDYPAGRANVRPVPNQELVLKVDAVVTALGYAPIPMAGIPVDDKGYIKVNKDGVSTEIEYLFAGGDAAGGDTTLISAAAAGKKAAWAIDRYLQKKYYHIKDKIGEE